MLLRIFGLVELEIPGRSVDVGTPQQRLVLAMLALRANCPMTTESLIDGVWDRAPRGARRTLQVQISRLRRLLGSLSDRGDVQVLSRSGGYQLHIEPDDIDVHRFNSLSAQAAAVDVDHGERAARLREALDLWRGEPLAGLPGGWAARTREEWRQRRIGVAVDWASAELAVGRSDDLIGPLTALAGEYPLVESLTEMRMRALCAAGRSGEALQLYGHFREGLVNELGVDPGPRLQSVYLAALRGELVPTSL